MVALLQAPLAHGLEIAVARSQFVGNEGVGLLQRFGACLAKIMLQRILRLFDEDKVIAGSGVNLLRDFPHGLHGADHLGQALAQGDDLPWGLDKRRGFNLRWAQEVILLGAGVNFFRARQVLFERSLCSGL